MTTTDTNLASSERGEVGDAVPPMNAPHTEPKRRAKAFSDISAMVAGTGGIDVPYNSRMLPYDAAGLDSLPEKDQEVLRDAIMNATGRSGRKKTKSDVAAMMAQGLMDQGGGAPRNRSRQGSNADVITKFGYAPQLGYDDLRMAEAIVRHGNMREREESTGVSAIAEIVQAESDRGDVVDEHGNKREKVVDDFVYNHVGHTDAEAEVLLAKFGRNALPEKIVPKWRLYLDQFRAPMPIMIWIAIVIEAAITNWIDMGILLVIQFTNATISFYELNKAGNAVAALKNSLKPTATCKRNGKWAVVDATLLVPGDLVLLASGSAIPADCRVNHSEIEVDQAALTGESLPVTFYEGDSCKMGSTCVRGEVEATVEFTGADTFFGKTASLLASSGEISHLQKVLMKFMVVLVVLSVSLCLIVFIYLLVGGLPLKEALSHTVVLLVASIPLAIEIVTNTTLAIGSKALSKEGAIVARLSAIEDLAGMCILCSDKTGTLTLNQMVLQEETPTYSPGETQETVLVYAALAARWKEPPRDALDRLTLGSVNMDLLVDYEQTEFVPFDPRFKRTEGTLRNTKTGAELKTTKGAPHIILGLLSASDREVKELVEASVVKFGEMGIRTLAVAKMEGHNGEWKMMGLLTFLDPPRPDTKQTIIDANKYGVNVKMVTGDHLLIAKNTAKTLAMGDKIFTSENLPMLDPVTKEKPPDLAKTYGNMCLAADGFAQMFPEHKYLVVETLRELGYSVGATGDGVNDAPALKHADVGIAVKGATDAANAAADIILTEDGLSTIVFGIIIAREIFSRISNFITYRISATLQLLIFFFIAVFAFHPQDFQPVDEEWPEYFFMPVLMLMLITLLNDGTLITIAYDYAEASMTPNSWNIPALFITSTVLGMVSCLSSLLLLWFLLTSHEPSGLFAKLGLGGVYYGQITTAIYLKVSVSDFLTLFSARTGPKFFFKIKPAPILAMGGCVALTISSLLAIFWPNSTPDGIPAEGLRSNMAVWVFVWLYCIVWWFIQDAAKVVTYKLMYKYNFNNINALVKMEVVGTEK